MTKFKWRIGSLAVFGFVLVSGAANAASDPGITAPATPCSCESQIAAPERLLQLAQQAQPAPPAAPATAADSTATASVGSVAAIQGNATATRNGKSLALKLKDDIFKGDILRTGANSSLGVIFDDETTFNLTANASIAVDEFVYQEGGGKNAALFNVVQGTIAFVANAVAKTGDMTISTPTSTLGIRGTTGLVEVGQGAGSAGATSADNIKLYPDADGRVGRIEINGRNGVALGVLSRPATGFSIRPSGGSRFAAVPLQISAVQAARDQGIVRQVHAAQNFGRNIVTERRNLRQPGSARPPGVPNQPGVSRQPNLGRPPTARPPQAPLPPRPNLQNPTLQQQNPQRLNLQQKLLPPRQRLQPGKPRPPARAVPKEEKRG